MSRDIPNNNDSPELPFITVVTNLEETFDQDYPNYEVKRCRAEEDMPSFFNSVLEEAKDGDLIFFLPDSDFTFDTSLSKFARPVMDNELVGIVYADNLNDGFSIRYPAFSMDVLTNKAVINSPFLFKTGGGSRFDPKFTSLYLHRFITQATMPTRTAAHVAETLVAKLGGNISSVSIDELKNLNG